MAGIVANAIRAIDEPVLVLCGARSSDRGTGDLAALLANEFGAAQALGLVRLDPQPDHLIAERRIDRGGRERLRVPLPAVCSVEAAGVSLRRASMQAAIASAGEPIPVAAESFPAGPGPIVPEAPRARRPRTHLVPAPAGDARERLALLTGVTMKQERATVTGPLSADDGADQLLAYLRRLGYLADEKQGAG
jgi:electron transfer flavoprotein beta subunit